MFSSYRLSIWFAIYICAVALTQLVGAKTIPLHILDLPISASASLVLVPCVLMMVDAVLESYGRPYANSMICASACAVVFIAIVAKSMTTLPAYTSVFTGSWRFACTSLLSFACLQVIDVICLTRLRRSLHLQSLWIRLTIAAAIALAVDTFIFTLVDHVNGHEPAFTQVSAILRVFLPYWILRTFVASLGIPLAYAGIYWLRSAPELCTKN